MTSQAEGSRSLQRSILVYTAGAFLIVGAAVALASVLPLYQRLRTDQERSLRHALALRALSVSELCRNIEQVALQVTSRSKARQRLEAHNRGEVSLAEAARFTRPILQDALDRADGVRGITRVGLSGALIASVGVVTPKEHRSPLDGVGARLSGPVTVEGARSLVVGAPILDRQGARVGTDYLLFDLVRLGRLVEEGKGAIGLVRGEAVERVVGDPSGLQEAIKAGALGGSGTLHGPGDRVIAYAPIEGSPGWGMALAQDATKLYAPLQAPLLLSGGLLLGLLLLGTLGMVSFLRPLTRRAIHADELEDVVAERTRALADEYAERRRAEEAQRELERQVLESQRLEGLGVLAGGIAHDFNNLLMGVLGNADLGKATAADAETRESFERICAAAERAAELCRQLLAYAGQGQLAKERLDLNELVGEMIKLVEVSLSKTADLKLSFGAGVPAVEADATQLRQVALNLITNASEALGDEPGEITISTGCVEGDGLASLPGAVVGGDEPPAGRYSYLEVTDTGCGMDAATRERMFDPFFTTKFTGRGLGMAAVLGIVRSHAGVLQVQSSPGEGTTIRVCFPSVGAEAAPEPKPTPASDSGGGARDSGLVLVVDDDPGVRLTTQGLVQHLGFEAVTASDGEQALDRFRERRAEVRCVLLDLTMPKVGGVEVLRALRREEPSLRVVIMSGYADPVGDDELRDTEFLRKPFTAKQLEEAIQRCLE